MNNQQIRSSAHDCNSTKNQIAILLPARNEALTIQQSIIQFHQVLPDALIYIIDNNSDDQTGQIAEKTLNDNKISGAVLSELSVGKGNAVKLGLREMNADIYVLCDADLTYPIDDVTRLIQPVLDRRADMVMGDRFSGGGYYVQNQRRFHFFGNRLLTVLINLFFNQRYKDVATGFRVLSRSFVNGYQVNADGFDLELDFVIHAAALNLSVIEIPISYKNRPAGSFSKLSTFRDGAINLRVIIARFFASKLKSI